MICLFACFVTIFSLFCFLFGKNDLKSGASDSLSSSSTPSTTDLHSVSDSLPLSGVFSITSCRTHFALFGVGGGAAAPTLLPFCNRKWSSCVCRHFLTICKLMLCDLPRSMQQNYLDKIIWGIYHARCSHYYIRTELGAADDCFWLSDMKTKFNVWYLLCFVLK